MYSYSEPYTQAAKQVATKSEYDAIVNEWDKKVDGHPVTKYGGVAIGLAAGATGHHWLTAHGGGTDLQAGLVGTGSPAATLLVKPVVKHFIVGKPEKVDRVDNLNGLAKQHKERVAEVKRIAGVAKQKARNDDYFWFNVNGDMISVMRSMIADTDEEQAAFKDALPVIRGKHATQKHIVPWLQKAHSHFNPDLYDGDLQNETIIGNQFHRRRTGFGNDPYNSSLWDGKPILDEAVGEYTWDLQHDRSYYNRDLDMRHETKKAAHHLHRMVPDLIQYLKGN